MNAARWLRVAAWTFVAAALLLKGIAAFSAWPHIGCDEVFNIEPVVEFVTHGHYANPGFAEQIPVDTGTHTLRNWTTLYWPVYGWVQLAFAAVLGPALWVHRLGDALLLAGAVAAMAAAGRSRFSPTTTAWMTVTFLLCAPVWWAAPGRADVLGCLLGLVVFARTWRQSASSCPRSGWWVLTGLLLGGTAMTHHFAAAVWGLAVAGQWLCQWGWRAVLRRVLWLGLGCVLGLSVLLPVILVDPPFWHGVFSAHAGIKRGLAHQVGPALGRFFTRLVVENPLPLALAGVAGILAWRRRAGLNHPAVWLAAVLGAGVLAHARLIEFYNINSHVTFWALTVLLGAFGFEAVTRWWWTAPRSRTAAAVATALVAWMGWQFFIQGAPVALLLTGLKPWEKRAEVQALLQREIQPDDAVLAHTGVYFEVPSRRRTVMWWHDKLDLAQFDWIALMEPQPLTDVWPDQLVNSLTQPQASVFREQFVLKGKVEPRHWGGPPQPGQTPQTWCVYLFERKNRSGTRAPVP